MFFQTLQEEQYQRQQQYQIQKQQQNKFVGLINSGNLCYLNSTVQVIFNLPLLCDEVIKYFEKIDESELNSTAKSFLAILKEKKEINETQQDKCLDLSHLRVSFNTDLQKRHRDADNTFGNKQNDSSEFFVLLFEFLIKHGKNQDLKNKNHLLGLRGKNSDTPPWQIEKSITKRQYDFNSQQLKLFQDYFQNESQNEESELQKQIDDLKKSLNGMKNPIEEYFFNGHIISYAGPCGKCGYESLSILDMAFFELQFPSSSWSSNSLSSMMDNYFNEVKVQVRCKNTQCDKFPLNILKLKNERTIYKDAKKKFFLINVPKILKILFKRYEQSSVGLFSKVSNQVKIPIFLSNNELKNYYYSQSKMKLNKNSHLNKEQVDVLTQTADGNKNYSYYLFAYSIQSGSLDSGHYVTKSIQYFKENSKIYYYSIVLNDSQVSDPIYGGDLSDSISVDAYWAIYVREDQEDFQHQINNNQKPKNIKTKSSFL